MNNKYNNKHNDEDEDNDEDNDEVNNKINDNSKLFGTIDIDANNFAEELVKLVKEYGIVEITGIMSSEECDKHTEQRIQDMIKITDIKSTNIKSWCIENLPQQTRPGMFQEIICNTPDINEIRFTPKIRKIFKISNLH